MYDGWFASGAKWRLPPRCSSQSPCERLARRQPSTAGEQNLLPRVDSTMRTRRNIRKPGHDYSAAGEYLVTVCTADREPCLGEVIDGRIVLSRFGVIVCEEWNDLPRRFPAVFLGAFVILPNHLHAIITIRGVGAPLAGARLNAQTAVTGNETRRPSTVGRTHSRAGASPAPTLGRIIGAVKSLSDRRCRYAFLTDQPEGRFGRLWQRGYHDRIIRDPGEMERARDYIRTQQRTMVGEAVLPIPTDWAASPTDF